MKFTLAIAGLAALAGCAKPGGTVLGQNPGADSVSAVRELKNGSQATISGVMYEKCPAAGCWFMLRDKSGVIRVDTKAAGFTVTDVPVNTEVTVRGSVRDSGEPILAATGMRY
jgi:uncharacterized protein YdeI (BOF family)